MEHIERSAVISSCGNYRYRLDRVWDKTLPKAMFIMLNPSTADGEQDDATIRRCIGFAKSWGYGGLMVGNVFAFRSTKPEYLYEAHDPIGKFNQDHLNQMYMESAIVVCAWGNGKLIENISKVINDYNPLSGFIGHLHYLELSKDGIPKHPLYLRKTLKPIKHE
ncbi:MAG: DUF1643 domain-containing protein [Saprospiraceae bacterium]